MDNSTSLAGLRTQEQESFDSASRGDFPAYASVLMPRSFSITAARQFRIFTGFPIPRCSKNQHLVFDQGWKHYIHDIPEGQGETTKKAPEGAKHVNGCISEDQWLIIQGRMDGNIFLPSAV